MSLTRNEWVEMWESVKTIEDRIRLIPRIRSMDCPRTEIEIQVNKIKKQIQSVIGQME